VVVIEAGMEAIPGYRLTEQLGAGGFAEVWEARNAAGGVVALKFLDTRKRDASNLQSEIRVLRGLRELSHPNIIEFYGVHARSHYLILSMERADGSLLDLLRAYRKLGRPCVPADETLDMLEQAAHALDFLMGQKLPCFNVSSPGLQHCDIKPSNLLLVGDTVKVADFGLCASTSWQTHRKGWKGTPPYAAPELFNGKASPNTDQYALAVTYCEMSLGEEVFFPIQTTDSPSSMPIDLTKIRAPEVPVLARAMARNWTDRWLSCEAFITALRAAVQSSCSTTRLIRPARVQSVV
jgi:serine/threonine-protein kinase